MKKLVSSRGDIDVRKIVRDLTHGPMEGTDGKEYHADIIVYPSALFVEKPMRGYDGRPIFPTRVQAAFTALCRCTYRPGNATCFEHAHTYLTGLYGDYRLPSSKHAQGANLLEEVYV